MKETSSTPCICSVFLMVVVCFLSIISLPSDSGHKTVPELALVI